jgi:benzoyl-CoA reductase/2-hydroxyglutaryl-CoA dehydratase subunit BcrC/BadD/HgdB
MASQLMIPEEVVELLAQAAEQLPQRTTGPQPPVPRCRVIIVGTSLDHPALLDWLSQHQVDVIDDDTCTLSRTFEPAVDLDPLHPLRDLPPRHLRRMPCPVQPYSAQRRGARLLSSIHQHGVQGIIFIAYKGCEPQAFDQVLMAQQLDQHAIAHLTLEIDPHLSSWEQIKARLEAFIEMFADWGPLGAPIQPLTKSQRVEERRGFSFAPFRSLFSRRQKHP